ncbi:EAL domain-containing protein [Azoarcus sp. L1K30]|uniref:bifunctional diguanylate cyclase/phosphodiesterase n=1 Tax=Azoarcus sp. L1K30 TaxID=2820277 RepID=UPI001B843FBB|nr:EAL domain-containing protein [Azoarcus sp. L1K30]MBR0568510.1 EAL domain-containing protein [Azoarcus sp. L1K30]
MANSAQLQRRIQTFSMAGILITGLLVAIATAFPIYRDARELATSAFIDDARAQARSASQYIGKATDIAGQIASRSGIRDEIDAYNRGKIDLAAVVNYLTPRLLDALKQSDHIVALTCLDRNGHRILELGLPIPSSLPLVSAATTPAIVGPLIIGDASVLLVSAPILSRDGQRVGTDILAFELIALEQVLKDAGRARPDTLQLLYNSVSGALMEIGHDARDGVTRVSQRPEQDFLARTTGGRTGIEPLEHEGGTKSLIAFSPLPEVPGWSFALVTPASTFDSPILSRIASPLLMITLLVLVGALLTSRAIRPIAAKVLEQSKQLSELSASLALAASVFEGSPQAVLILDGQRRILEVNEACYAITGFGLIELRGKTLCEALCLSDLDGNHCDVLWRQVADTGTWHGETILTRKDGGTFPAWHSVSAVRDAAGAPRHYITMFTDISDKRQAEDRIRHLAHHDALTGLPNRSLLADRLEHALDRARRGERKLALLFIDLDRFKHVNDSLGHPVGDRLLQEVARRLEATVRDQDTLARQGGDEFVVVIEDVAEAEDAARVAVKLLGALEVPIALDGHEIYVGGSIGISLFPNDGDSSDALLRCADSAMYEAKAQGRSTYRFYTAEQTRISRERFELEGGLRRAIERGELRLHYQPQASCADGRLCGAEALVRWQHPERGLVGPDRFIPLAEEIGLIAQIGEWVLNTACAQAQIWTRAGFPLRIAVNLSGQQVSRGKLHDIVGAALARSGLSPAQLELEITEGHVLARVEECIAELEQIKTLGVTLAIDDFGTGYSSLSYLKRLPIDRLKIDRSFVEGIPQDGDDVAIVATILSMASNLDLGVIAEGVENEGQLRHLVAAGCTEYQGYLLGRPMPADEFERWMQDNAQTLRDLRRG